MINQSSSSLHLAKLKTEFNKWRIAFLLFALIYAILLTLNLSGSSMQWDEVSNLNGGLMLKLGSYQNFVRGSFYPPLFDLAAMFSFNILGVSLVSGRLVSVVFSLLTLWVVFELASRMYSGKAGLISAILLGVMPGYIWLSRMAMLDVMLTFFSTLSLLFFYLWLNKHQNRMLVFSGLALGLGFLTKYQVVAVGAALIVSLLILGWGHLKGLFARFTLLVVAAAATITPWIIIVYRVYAAQILSQWVYALQIGNPGRSFYSGRFPTPIFYLIEMTWPYSDTHPISLLLYAFGLLGLGFFAMRRKKEDKFVLTWFLSVYVFFTLVSNRDWRYLVPLFPALAISAAGLTLFVYSKAENGWKRSISVNRKKAFKFAAALLIVFILVGTAYSISNAYDWVVADQVQVEIQAATNYAVNHESANQSIMVLCPFNLFSAGMVNFYLWQDGCYKINTYQYPENPVDTYTPTFNITEFINMCKENNVKFVFTYEYGGVVPYYNTTLNLMQIYMQLYASGNFTKISPQETFGTDPRRIFILNFTG
ncbi:MAG TPA: glycosyltransferase family 39 protein [Candidatus Limnocylindrales bacterium]|nr:glycosyltransferase family 39 protein [Candidatus Limnocylindrales bacterium]